MISFGMWTCTRSFIHLWRSNFKFSNQPNVQRHKYRAFWSPTAKLLDDNWPKVTKWWKSEPKPLAQRLAANFLGLQSAGSFLCLVTKHCDYWSSSLYSAFAKTFSKVYCLACACSWLGENNKKSIGFLPVLFWIKQSFRLKIKKVHSCLHPGLNVHHHQLLIRRSILAAALGFTCQPNISATGESFHRCYYHQCSTKKVGFFFFLRKLVSVIWARDNADLHVWAAKSAPADSGWHFMSSERLFFR